MIAERSNYLVYIKHIEVLILQHQDIKSDQKRTVDFITHIKDIIPVIGLPSLQQLSLNTVTDHHSEDLLLIRENINRTIDLVLCQAPPLDPRTEAYKTHSLQA